MIGIARASELALYLRHAIGSRLTQKNEWISVVEEAESKRRAHFDVKFCGKRFVVCVEEVPEII